MKKKGVYLSVAKTKSIDYVKQMDYVLLAVIVVMSVLGFLVLSSALKSAADGNAKLIKQGVVMLFGIIFAILLTRFDYKDYKVLGFLLYVVSIGMLIMVRFYGYGETTWGSKSWIKIPVIGSFQPSEICKITFILVVAVFLARIKDGEGSKFVNFVKLFIYASIPLILVILQPDIGTGLVFAFILGIMLFVYGMKLRYIIIPVIASIPAGIFAWFYLLNDARKNRVLVFLNPLEMDPEGIGPAYQIKRALMTIGSGKLTGKGLYHGVQTQKSVVPVKESDFIFTVICEELGFIGGALVILLFLILLIRLLKIAKESRDSYGSLLAAGVAGMFGFHFIQNIGMCISLMPITGIPLPFFSWGSSAMITNYIAVGIVLSVAIRKRKSIFERDSY